MNKTFLIEGMTCASCTNLIEAEARKLKGLQSLTVNFASEKASLEFNESEFDPETFVSLVESLGYRAIDSEKKSVSHNQKDILYQSIFLLILGSVFMLMMFKMEWFPFNHHYLNLVQLIISSLVFLFYAKFYLRNVFVFVTKFHSNMHTLIGIGILTNLIYSWILYLMNPHSHLFVEGVPFILGFTKLGQYFEHLAKTKAQTSLSSLYKAQIKFANLIKDDAILNCPVIELKIGNIIRVKPGEKIPVNGKITKGISHIDESLISGESIPLSKEINDTVIAGSINLEGSLDIEVLKEFNDSSVANIIKFVEKAESRKTSLEKIADKIVRLFVPIVIGIAILTFLFWFYFTNNLNLAFSHFIAVLVIACPCALGLAAPICTMITTRKAAQAGMLINGGDVIENGAHITTVVFDKTGTLTIGLPVVDLIQYHQSKILRGDALELVLSACSLSTHPLSFAIVNKLKTDGVKSFDPDKFKNVPGFGFEAIVDSNKILIGNQKYLESENIIVDANFSNENVGSYVFVAINHEHVFTFIINDLIKPQAKKLIEDLTSMNIETWMLTGDANLVAQSIGKKLGIKNILSQISPIEKANFIDELKKNGKKVAMVGDGINDAIALSQADLSIAMAQGSDVALASAQVSIIDNNLDLIVNFLKISKKTLFLIKQNLFFSFIYNIFCIPLAAGIFVSKFGFDLDPKWASLSMGLSSVSVILNSLRLKKE